jgi:hypothetical protein
MLGELKMTPYIPWLSVSAQLIRHERHPVKYPG